MKGSLRKAYSNKNVSLAFRRLQRNTDRHYKGFFRDTYQSYSVAGDEALYDLAKRLRSNIYTCEDARKTYVPKPSLVQRPMTLLGIEDQLVYQSMANIIADALYPVAQPNYFKKTFGNMYAGPGKEFFYVKWQEGYRRFTEALTDGFNAGHVWIASFDLTACYDSIDHRVLTHFLLDLGLDKEFCEAFTANLSHWSAVPNETPIYQGHGIPQGPMCSGIVAECVLRAFDNCPVASNGNVKYLRYVDDIKIMANTENELRKQLLELDRCSKRVGLFPQSSKINIHKIEDIRDEIKTISIPDLPSPFPKEEKNAQVAIDILTKNLKIVEGDESAFKYWLPHLPHNAKNGLRMVRVLERYPHLSSSIAGWFTEFKILSKKLSIKMILVLKGQSIYSGALAEFVSLLQEKNNPKCHEEFITFCLELKDDRFSMGDPVLRSSVKLALIDGAELKWRDKKTLIQKEDDWWVKSRLVRHIKVEKELTDARLESVLNTHLKSRNCDVSILAAERIGLEGMRLHRKPSEIPLKTTQLSLKNQSLLGTARTNVCPINTIFEESISAQWKPIDWKVLLGDNYKSFVSKIGRWRSYLRSNPTAWLNHTDTLNDLLLESVSVKDPTLSKYELGEIGSLFHKVKVARVNGSGNQKMEIFANACPVFFSWAESIHSHRLNSELSHPKERYTGKTTRYFTYKEMNKLLKTMPRAYNELWEHYCSLT